MEATNCKEIERVNSREKYILIRTSDMDSAKQIAHNFLKTIETDDTGFNTSYISIYKKDNGLIKVEYMAFLKNPKPEIWKLKKYNITIKDLIENEIVFDSSGVFEEIKKTMPISFEIESKIKYNMKSDYLAFTHYEEFDIDEYCNYHVEIKAL